MIPEFSFPTLTNDYHNTCKEIFHNFEHSIFGKTMLTLYLSAGVISRNKLYTLYFVGRMKKRYSLPKTDYRHTLLSIEQSNSNFNYWYVILFYTHHLKPGHRQSFPCTEKLMWFKDAYLSLNLTRICR